MTIKRNWLGILAIVLVFVVFGLGACATMSDLFWTPPPPEGYGILTIKNVSDAVKVSNTGKDSNDYKSPGTGTIRVNSLTDSTYSVGYGNIPGKQVQPSPLGGMTYTEGGSARFGKTVEWTAIKDGVEKQAKATLIPVGNYEVIVSWNIGNQQGSPTRHTVTIKNGEETVLEVRAR
jgi:hypothetical protein